MKMILALLLMFCFAVPVSMNSSQQSPTIVASEPLVIVSSWYGPGFHGKRAADGSIYDQRAYTVAHRAWPFGTQITLRNPKNSRVVNAKVTDRGPYIRGRGLDVSERIAEELGFKRQGIAKLEVCFP